MRSHFTGQAPDGIDPLRSHFTGQAPDGIDSLRSYSTGQAGQALIVFFLIRVIGEIGGLFPKSQPRIPASGHGSASSVT
jgi:hypothetical protein